MYIIVLQWKPSYYNDFVKDFVKYMQENLFKDISDKILVKKVINSTNNAHEWIFNGSKEELIVYYELLPSIKPGEDIVALIQTAVENNGKLRICRWVPLPEKKPEQSVTFKNPTFETEITSHKM